MKSAAPEYQAADDAASEATEIFIEAGTALTEIRPTTMARAPKTLGGSLFAEYRSCRGVRVLGLWLIF